MIVDYLNENNNEDPFKNIYKIEEELIIKTNIWNLQLIHHT